MSCLFLLSSLGLLGLVTASSSTPEVDAGSTRAGLAASLAVVLCGTAVAASGLLCWRRRKPSADEQPQHDLARLQDSVTVAKRKSGCGVCSVVPAHQHNCAAKPDDNEDETAAALRMVVFDSVFDSLPEEQKQRLKASSIQDSVIILRTKQTISRNASRADREEDEQGDEHSSKIVAFKPGTLLVASTAALAIHAGEQEQASEQEEQQQLGPGVPMDAAQTVRQPGQLCDGDGEETAATAAD